MRLRLILFLAAFLLVSPLQATTYYLATAADGGSNGNNGLAPETPWLSPAHALNCGDVIIATASTAYAASNFSYGNWGTVTCTEGNNVAWLKCETFLGCKITAASVNGMTIGKSYWGVQGWEVTTTGSSALCFVVQPQSTPLVLHHIIFANNFANGCISAGFAFASNGTAASFDYVAVVGNIAWNTTVTTDFCNSGITLWEPLKLDSAAGTHIYVAGNFSLNNVSGTNCGAGDTTFDGNGIILDDFGYFQTGGTPYDQQVLVENNMVLWNGGWGIGTSGDGTTEATIYFRYNTSVGNLTDVNTDFTTCGELVLFGFPDGVSNVSATNNLVQAGAAQACSGGVQNLYAGRVESGDATDALEDNWLYSAAGNNTLATNSTGFSFGSNVTGTDPELTNPADPGQPNCAGATSVPDCMTTVIANFTPEASGADAYGYQPVSGTPVYDPLFPAWLCDVDLPAGLVTMGCAEAPATQPTFSNVMLSGVTIQ